MPDTPLELKSTRTEGTHLLQKHQDTPLLDQVDHRSPPFSAYLSSLPHLHQFQPEARGTAQSQGSKLPRPLRFPHLEGRPAQTANSSTERLLTVSKNGNLLEKKAQRTKDMRVSVPITTCWKRLIRSSFKANENWNERVLNPSEPVFISPPTPRLTPNYLSKAVILQSRASDLTAPAAW